MNRLSILLCIIFCPLMTSAQHYTDLMERGLNGKIHTFIQYDYNQEIPLLKDGKIKDSTRWYTKRMYHYDTLGRLQKMEYAVKCLPQSDCDVISGIIIYERQNNETISRDFNDQNKLCTYTIARQTSDTSYTLTIYNAETNAITYISEQTLNAAYRDIAGKFSFFSAEDGVSKLSSQKAYKNTLDSNGRLIISVETDLLTAAVTKTLFRYIALDTKGNPTRMVWQKEGTKEPYRLSIRTYTYYNQ